MPSHSEVCSEDPTDHIRTEGIRVSRRQLGSPLIRAKITAAENMYRRLPIPTNLRRQELIEVQRVMDIAGSLAHTYYPTKEWTWDHHTFLGTVLKSESYGKIAKLFNFREILRISETISIEAALGCGLSSIRLSETEKLKVYEDHFHWSSAWDWITHLRSIPGELAKFARHNRRDTEIPFGDLTFHIIDQWIFVSWKSLVILYDENTFLMTADAIRGKWACILTTLLSYPRQEEISLQLKELVYFYSWGGELLERHSELSYKVFKEIEAVCTEVLRYGFEKRPDPFANTSFYPSVVASLPETWMQEAIATLYDFLMPLTPQKVSEIFGLFRAFGHPYVNGPDGVSALRSLTTTLKPIDLTSVRRTHRIFRRCFCISYIAKHNTWPLLMHPPIPGQYLDLCFRKNIPPNLSDVRYRENEWDNIRFGANAFIPEKMSISDLLDDKSISPPKSAVLTQLEKTGYAGPRNSRSLIEQALDSNFPNPKEFLRSIEEKGYSSEDEIMILTCKERELKFPAARMFGQQTLTCRLVTVIGEHLVKEHILPHFKQVTMTYSAHQLRNLMARMSRSLGIRQRSIDVLINIDFSKWNSNFRDPLVRPFFQDMDDILGYPGGVLSKTHYHFSKSLMIYTGEGHTLKFLNGHLIPGDSWFRGNLGGVEGLRQKPWTVITVCKITEVAEKLRIPFENIGQGDNQVIRLRIPYHKHPHCDEANEVAENEARRKLILFLDTLEEEFKSIGLPLKIDETWTSSRLFAYGKHLILEGVYLPMVLKRLFRANGGGNDIFPTLSEDIASIFSNCGSAAESYYYPQMPYFIAVFQAIVTIQKYLKFSPVSGKNLEEVLINRRFYRLNNDHVPLPLPTMMSGNFFNLDVARSVFFMTRSLGGLPVQTLPEFIIKGHPDPVTNAIALLGKLWKRYPNSVFRNLLDLPLSPIIREKMLIQDPLSLNLLAPESCESVIKQCSEDYLLYRGAENPEFDQILKTNQHQTDQLKTSLYRVSPMFPALMHEVANACAEGHIERIKGKVSRMRTLATKAVSLSAYSLVQTMKRCEELSLLYHVLSINKHGCGVFEGFLQIEGEFCSKRYTQYLRTKGWARDDIIGTTVPSPLESLGTLQIPEEKPDEDAFALTVYKYINHIQPQIFRTMGPKIPYTGSTTKEKQSLSEGMRTYDLSSLVAPCADLVRLIGFVTTENGPIANLIRNALRSVTDAPSELFETNSEQATGSSFHRMRSKVLIKTGRIGILPHLFSFVDIHSDKIITGGRGSENTDVVFSTHFIWAMMKVVDKVFCGEPLGRGYDCRIVCARCVSIIEGDVLVGNPEAEEILFRSWPENPYLYQSFSTYKLKIGTHVHGPEFLSTKIHSSQLKSFYPQVEQFSSVHYIWEILRSSPNDLDELEYGADFKISWLSRIDAPSIFYGLWEGILRWTTFKLLLRGDNPFLVKGISKEIHSIPGEILGRLRPLITDAESVDALLDAGLPVQIRKSTRLTREAAGEAIKESFFLYLDSLAEHRSHIESQVLSSWSNIPTLYEGIPSAVIMTLWSARCAYERVHSLEYMRDVGRLISRERSADAVTLVMNQIGPFDDQIKVWANTIDGAYRHFPNRRAVDRKAAAEKLWTWDHTVEYTGDEEGLGARSSLSEMSELNLYYPEGLYLDGLTYPLPGKRISLRYLSLLGAIPDEVRVGLINQTGVFLGDHDGSITTVLLHALQLKSYYYGIDCGFTGERETHFSFIRPWATSLSSSLNMGMMRNYKSVSQVSGNAREVNFGDNLQQFLPDGCSFLMYHFGKEWFYLPEDEAQKIAIRLALVIKQLMKPGKGSRCALLRFPKPHLSALISLQYALKHHLPDQRLLRSLYSDPRSHELFMLCTSLQRSSAQYFPDLSGLNRWISQQNHYVLSADEARKRSKNAVRAIFDRLTYSSSLRILYPAEVVNILCGPGKIKSLILSVHSYIRGKPISRYRKLRGKFSLSEVEEIHWAVVLVTPLLIILCTSSLGDWYIKLYQLLQNHKLVIWEEDGWESGSICTNCSVNTEHGFGMKGHHVIEPLSPRILYYLMAAGQVIKEKLCTLSFVGAIMEVKDYYCVREGGTLGYIRSEGKTLWYPRNWKRSSKEKELVFVPKSMSSTKEESFGDVNIVRFNPQTDYPGSFTCNFKEIQIEQYHQIQECPFESEMSQGEISPSCGASQKVSTQVRFKYSLSPEENQYLEKINPKVFTQPENTVASSTSLEELRDWVQEGLELLYGQEE